MKTHWLSSFIKRLWAKEGAGRLDRAAPMSDPDTLKQMVRGIIATRPDELGCDECFQQVDRFAEMVLDGKPAAEAMPLVQEHLDRCGDCREEFEALLAALRAVA